MSARRNDITPTRRIQLVGKMVSSPGLNRSELARKAGLSRPSLYAVEAKGRSALEQCFDPVGPPLWPNREGYWLWVDENAIKRAVLTLRAALGASLSAIVEVLLECFGLRLSESSVRSVVQEGYQRAFDYQQSASLQGVKRAAFDEMFRWGRCILTGVDCDSLFILLGEKQPGRTNQHWTQVMQRLREQHGLLPQQVAVDGARALDLGVRGVWKEARLVHDIAHVHIWLQRVRGQFEQRAYRAIDQLDALQQRRARGKTKKNWLEKLQRKLDAAEAKQNAAIEQAEEANALVQEAYAALSVIDPCSGRLNDPQLAQARLQAVSVKLKRLPSTWAVDAATYLAAPAQQVAQDRAEFGRVLLALAQRRRVPLQTVEHCAHLWQLRKQHNSASWPGTRQQLEQQMLELWMRLCQDLQPADAKPLLIEVFGALRQVLAASSPVEWANGRLSAALPAQKRPSSGMLQLRAAYLNLQRFVDGRRKGSSPHELLTGERVDDWLSKLGYAPRSAPMRSLKKLGWPRLVAPFEPTWRQNWLGIGLNEALTDADEQLDAAA